MTDLEYYKQKAELYEKMSKGWSGKNFNLVNECHQKLLELEIHRPEEVETDDSAKLKELKKQLKVLHDYVEKHLGGL